MSLQSLLITPFVEFGFMRRALVACLALGLSCGPAARLHIGAAVGGGCRAEIHLPWRNAAS